MKLKTKVWLLLGVLMGIVLAIDLTVGYRKLGKELRAEAEYDARTIYGFMMATRRIYQQVFVDSGLPITKKTVAFLPAHSFSRISKDFANWNQNGIIFNNVSDKPRNPGNLADAFEREAIDWFRANPGTRERMRDIVDTAGTGYLLYTAPIWVEQFCLKCHGDPMDAPPSIRESYDTAYGYRVGELRGVVSIKLPMAKFHDRFVEIWGGQLIKSLLSYAILFFALGLLLEDLVIRRLAGLREGAERIAAGDYGERIVAAGNDEVVAVARSLNHLADEVQAREQAVGKLSQAIEQSPQSVVITDLAGRIEYVNDFFVRNSGYSRAEVLGENPRILQSGKTPPETFSALWAALTRGNSWQGEFINRRKDGSEYIEMTTLAPVRSADGGITHYLAVKQDITEKKRAEAEINRLAYFDGLTGLPNRTLLIDRLGLAQAIALRRDHLDALLLINIDRFKNLNDARGHALGDQLLVAIGGRLAALLREGDTLARLASDEFSILLPDIGEQREAAVRRALALAERILATLREPFHCGDDDVIMSASIGITLTPDSAHDKPLDVLRRAETALHRAKEAGGGCHAFFESGMGEAAEQRFRVERELRRAIADHELRLYLQPQVDAAGCCIGAEVLVRWQHPERGLIPPSVFIPIAEESDLIVDLGVWVLTEACALSARENMAGFPLHLSVNLSPRHFRQPGFVTWISALLAASGADPNHLTLEVTEGLVIDNIGDIVAKMSVLNALGIRFSVDDFGTGYSSLAYLKRLPIHELKIDKTFVQDAPDDPDDAALVETILAVAKHMRLKVVAEGVETAEQAAFLNARANLIHQGYLFGRPEPAETWIERWHTTREPPAENAAPQAGADSDSRRG